MGFDIAAIKGHAAPGFLGGSPDRCGLAGAVNLEGTRVRAVEYCVWVFFFELLPANECNVFVDSGTDGNHLATSSVGVALAVVDDKVAALPASNSRLVCPIGCQDVRSAIC